MESIICKQWSYLLRCIYKVFWGYFFFLEGGSFLSDLKFVNVPQNKETGNFYIVRFEFTGRM